MDLQETIRRILKGVANKLSNKLHCDRHGSCVHFAELFVEEINNTHPELLKEFEVIEGYVDVKFGERKPQEHTWIRLSNDEVIDPTFMQFTKYDKNAKYSRKRTKSSTGQEYYDVGVRGSWFSKRREEQPDTVFKGRLEESIRKILREELASREVESIESNDELDEYSRTLRNARKQGSGLRFPKTAIKNNPLRFRPYSRETVEDSDPKVGTGKKPKGSERRLYTDENPSDTVSVKFKTKEDIIDTLNKDSFKSKSHKRQSQIINLIHQRVRAAYQNAKDPETKKRLKRGLDYIENEKEKSKEKTIQLQKQEQNESELTEKCWAGYEKKGMKTMFGKRYPNCVKKTK
jgi:hypothetical protein